MNSKNSTLALIVMMVFMTISSVLYASPPKTMTNNVSLSNQFNDPNYKFSIKYPSNWIYEQPVNGKIIFSGKKGTTSYYDSVVNIQIIPTKETGGIYNSTTEVIDNLKNQIASKASKIEVLGKGPIELTQNSKKFNGELFVFNYTFKDQEFKQMLFVILRPDHQAFYAWTYNATKQQYSIDLPIAKAMFQSWRIN